MSSKTRKKTPPPIHASASPAPEPISSPPFETPSTPPMDSTSSAGFTPPPAPPSPPSFPPPMEPPFAPSPPPSGTDDEASSTKSRQTSKKPAPSTEPAPPPPPPRPAPDAVLGYKGAEYFAYSAAHDDTETFKNLYAGTPERIRFMLDFHATNPTTDPARRRLATVTGTKLHAG